MFEWGNITQAREEEVRDEYEFYDEWKDSDAKDEGVDIETYDYYRRIEAYGLDEEDTDDE